MLRRIDPDLEPDNRRKAPEETTRAAQKSGARRLRAGQRRTLEDILNPARFYLADGVQAPSTAHTPLSVLILTGAGVILVSLLAFAWVTTEGGSLTGFALITSIVGRQPGLPAGELHFQLLPILPALPLALFLLFRAGLTILYRENPRRGIWLWMIVASLVNLYPFLHTVLILDYIVQTFLESEPLAYPLMALGGGFWVALAGNVMIIALSIGGWLFFSQQDDQ